MINPRKDLADHRSFSSLDSYPCLNESIKEDQSMSFQSWILELGRKISFSNHGQSRHEVTSKCSNAEPSQLETIPHLNKYVLRKAVVKCLGQSATFQPTCSSANGPFSVTGGIGEVSLLFQSLFSI